MTEQQSSYRQIMKATSIFGGVQVFNILISIIRSKFVAILLGPAGMGIVGLLTTTINLVGSLTNFGLGTSAVKNVAEANASNNSNRIATVVTVLRRLVWITGTLGTLLTILFSPWLSQLTFGNRDYTFSFMWVAVTLLFNQLSSGQMVLLQGMRKLKYLANATLTGSILGLFISIPIYYIWGINGIVPVMVVTSIVSMIRSWYFARKVNIEKAVVSKQTTIAVGKEMLKMGFMLSLSSLIVTGASYLLRIYISNTAGVEQVGLYTAGFVIIETYVGMVFTSMATDYYPKLSAVNSDNSKIRELAGQQATIALLILVPIVILFLVFSSVAIQILYSKRFLPIENMVNWAILGTLFKAASWSMGFILFAKSDSKLFIKTALGFNTVFLAINMFGFSIWGLNGLGVTYLINFILHFLSLLIITKYRYQFSFNQSFYRIFILSIAIGITGFSTTSMITTPLIKYPMGIFLFIGSCIFSFIEFDKRLNLKEILSKYYAKIKK
jgi:O-antigen/teichoic acid export membrane protein